MTDRQGNEAPRTTEPTSIRKAEPADADTVRSLIVALADFEKLPPPDEAAQTRLINDAFGPNPRFEIFLAEVGGKVAAEQVEESWLRDEFIPTVAKRGAAIIEARGASSAASAANAAVDHVRDWVSGTPEGDWTSAALVSDGSYGVQEGLISSFPVVSRGGRWEIVQGLEIDAFSREKIDASVAELAEEREAVTGLGLI